MPYEEFELPVAPDGTKLTGKAFRPDGDYVGPKEELADVVETATFQVGSFTCELTMRGRKQTCEWSPRLPRPGELFKADLKSYQAGRDRVYQRVANRIGAATMVIE